jgi:hypothetical protein
VKDEDYYFTQGTPSMTRLFGNLAESIFWTEKLMSVMAGRRTKQFGVAAAAVLAVLVGLVLVQPSGMLSADLATKSILAVLRVLTAGVAALVAVDIYGERGDFLRGAGECSKLFAAIDAALRSAVPSRDEGIRLFVEYSCLVADLPMIPDKTHAREKDRLDRLWKEVAEKLPPAQYLNHST